MQLRELTAYIESIAPPTLQESYDNSGLLIGSPDINIKGVLISLDLTESIIDEAIEKNANVIITHHPIIFRGLKRINGNNYVERCVIKAIKNDIAIYSAHTNLDNIINGVNGKIAEKLDLQNTSVLKPLQNTLLKLITYVPTEYADTFREAIFKAGAGQIGNYDSCSYNTAGIGTFRPQADSNPFVGTIGELHKENEVKIETIFPYYLQSKIIKTIYANHPYEEPAYDIYALQNSNNQIGAGIIGMLKTPVDSKEFLEKLKSIFNVSVVRHTEIHKPTIQKVALCGGSGSFLLSQAKSHKADIFISGDFKYHDFFDAENSIIIADIGHYESEQFTKNIFYELITKKFSTFACSISKINTNPIKYL